MKKFVIIFLLLAAVFVLCSGCSKASRTARKELKNIGVTYDKKEFMDNIIVADTITVSLFLEAGMNPNMKRGVQQITPLQIASTFGHTEIAELLMKSGE